MDTGLTNFSTPNLLQIRWLTFLLLIKLQQFINDLNIKKKDKNLSK